MGFIKRECVYTFACDRCGRRATFVSDDSVPQGWRRLQIRRGLGGTSFTGDGILLCDECWPGLHSWLEEPGLISMAGWP